MIEKWILHVYEHLIDFQAALDALNRLSEIEPRTEQMVELRFFGGLSIEDAARILDVSPITIKYDWRMARAWLSQELGE